MTQRESLKKIFRLIAVSLAFFTWHAPTLLTFLGDRPYRYTSESGPCTGSSVPVRVPVGATQEATAARGLRPRVHHPQRRPPRPPRRPPRGTWGPQSDPHLAA